MQGSPGYHGLWRQQGRGRKCGAYREMEGDWREIDARAKAPVRGGKIRRSDSTPLVGGSCGLRVILAKEGGANSRPCAPSHMLIDHPLSEQGEHVVPSRSLSRPWIELHRRRALAPLRLTAAWRLRRAKPTLRTTTEAWCASVHAHAR